MSPALTSISFSPLIVNLTAPDGESFDLANKRIITKNKIKSFNVGWMFGFGYFISNLYWITNSLTFEDIFKPLIPFALILIPVCFSKNIFIK